MVRPRFVGLILLLLTLLVYLPVWRHGFLVFDDPEYVSENYQVQAGLNLTGVEWAFTSFHASNWHPLTWLSHMFDCELFELDAGAHHLMNVLFHAANALLLFALWNRLTSSLWPAAFVAAVFAWHPLHVESVAWIAERKDVLSTFFGLLSLHAYVRYAQSKPGTKPSGHGGNAKRYYLASLVLFALGLMAKPMLVTMPFLLLLLDYWPLRRFTIDDLRFTIWRLVREKIPLLILTVGSCVVTYLAQRGEAVVSLARYPVDLRLANAIVSYVRYLGKMFWPTDQAVIYPLTKIPAILMIGASILFLAICFGALALRRRHPFVLVGWFWFVGMLVPVIGVVQVGAQAMADRYTYLPMTGILVIVAFGSRALVEKFPRGHLPVRMASALVLLACLILTVAQLRYWRDSETLFKRAIAVTEENYVAQINLGTALEQKGQKDEAVIHYAEALRISPHREQSHNNLANILADLGRRDEAVVHYREALRLNPNAVMAHANFGTLLVEMGKFDEAEEQYAEAIRLAPDNPRPHYLLGKANLRRGRSAAAVTNFREALKWNPRDFQTLTYFARLLATDLSPEVRNGAEAVTLAERANELTNGEQPLVLDTLSLALAESGRFAEAQETVQQAIRLAAEAGLPGMVSDLEGHLKLFQANQPVRETSTNWMTSFQK